MKHLGRLLSLAALLGLVAVAAPAVAAERSVVVTVVNDTGAPLAGVAVVVACDREFIAQTDANGEVRFSTQAAQVEVTATDADGKTASAKSSANAIRVSLNGRS